MVLNGMLVSRRKVLFHLSLRNRTRRPHRPAIPGLDNIHSFMIFFNPESSQETCKTRARFSLSNLCRLCCHSRVLLSTRKLLKMCLLTELPVAQGVCGPLGAVGASSGTRETMKGFPAQPALPTPRP